MAPRRRRAAPARTACWPGMTASPRSSSARTASRQDHRPGRPQRARVGRAGGDDHRQAPRPARRLRRPRSARARCGSSPPAARPATRPRAGPRSTTRDDEEARDRVAEWLVEASGHDRRPASRGRGTPGPQVPQAPPARRPRLRRRDRAQWVEWIYAGERARDQVDDLLRSNGFTGRGAGVRLHLVHPRGGQGSVLFTAFGLADAYTRPSVRAVSRSRRLRRRRAVSTSAGTLIVVAPRARPTGSRRYFTALSPPRHPRGRDPGRRGGRADAAAAAARPGRGRQRVPLPAPAAPAHHRPRQRHPAAAGLPRPRPSSSTLYGGREVARTVVSNAKLRLLLPGVADLDTLRYWSAARSAGPAPEQTSQTRG